jgi:trehalose/maltose transport system substrate-binding protein
MALARKLLLVGLILTASIVRPALAATLTLACEAIDQAAQGCRVGAEAWGRKNGHTVKVIAISNSPAERLNLYQQLLAAKSPLIDIYMIDIVWSGMLAESLVDLSGPAASTIGNHFPAIVKNNTIGGRLIGMPWFTDVGLLFYRKDLLAKYNEKVPQTWQELSATARKIQRAERNSGHAAMWGYLWQGIPGESLTCDALEWIASHDGGSVVSMSGEVTIDNPAAIAALNMAKGWINDISPRSVLQDNEDASRDAFAAGNAVFMRNWPYAWAKANMRASPVRDKVGIALLPAGPNGRAGISLGGQQLAVSRFSRHPAEAIALVMYLTSREEQKRRAVILGLSPTISSLYQDPELRALNPYQEILRRAVAGATARPSTVTGRQYENVSSEFWEMVSGVLAEGKDPAASVKALDTTLRAMQTNGKW